MSYTKKELAMNQENIGLNTEKIQYFLDLCELCIFDSREFI